MRVDRGGRKGEMGKRGEREDVKWEQWWRRRGLTGGMMEKN